MERTITQYKDIQQEKKFICIDSTKKILYPIHNSIKKFIQNKTTQVSLSTIIQ